MHNKTITHSKYLFFIIFMVIFSLIGLTGCSQQEYINDKETGEIDAGEPTGLQEGDYILISRYFDRFGYRQQLEASVHDGLITKAILSEYTADGVKKTDVSAWSEKETGYRLSEVYHLFAEDIIETQSSKISEINGASKISTDFKTLAEAFIDRAKKGCAGETTVCLGETYSAESDFESGFHSTLTITFNQEDHISQIAYTETLNDVDRSVNPAYRQLFEEMTAETQSVDHLDPLNEASDYSDEINRYNTLLIAIADQRNSGSGI